MLSSEQFFRIAFGCSDLGDPSSEIFGEAALGGGKLRQRNVVLVVQAALAIALPGPPFEFLKRVPLVIVLEPGDDRHHLLIQLLLGEGQAWIAANQKARSEE